MVGRQRAKKKAIGARRWLFKISLLRWAFVEAVVPAIRSDEYLRFEYDDLRKRMNWNKAKVAMARRILNGAFKVLKDKKPYKKLNKVEHELEVDLFGLATCVEGIALSSHLERFAT